MTLTGSIHIKHMTVRASVVSLFLDFSLYLKKNTDLTKKINSGEMLKYSLYRL
jgi:hypothetical protein